MLIVVWSSLMLVIFVVCLSRGGGAGDVCGVVVPRVGVQFIEVGSEADEKHIYI